MSDRARCGEEFKLQSPWITQVLSAAMDHFPLYCLIWSLTLLDNKLECSLKISKQLVMEMSNLWHVMCLLLFAWKITLLSLLPNTLASRNLNTQKTDFSCGEASPQPVTLMARPAGVNFSVFRSLRQSSPIKEVRCWRHSACPCDAAMCNRLFPFSSWILSRLSAARCGCTNSKIRKQVNTSE